MPGLIYNPNLVLINWGRDILSGFNADDIVAISFDEDAVTTTYGSQGEWVWVVNQNRGGKAKISFLQGAPILAQLSAAVASVGPRKKKLDVRPFSMTDLAGTALAVGPQAIITKMPDINRKKTHQPVEVTFQIGEWTKIVNGGISTPDGPGGSLISAVKDFVPSISPF